MKVLCVGFKESDVLEKLGWEKNEDLGFETAESLDSSFDFNKYNYVLLGTTGHQRNKVVALINAREKESRRKLSALRILLVASDNALLQHIQEIVPLTKPPKIDKHHLPIGA